jgi:hypothetical protein
MKKIRVFPDHSSTGLWDAETGESVVVPECISILPVTYQFGSSLGYLRVRFGSFLLTLNHTDRVSPSYLSSVCNN